MGERENNPDFYKELLLNYPIKDRFRHLLIEMQDLISALGVEDYVTINEDLLGKAVLDYFEDVDKLKKYEGMTRINVSKIYAYETYWLIRRSPIQLVQSQVSKEILHINEKVFSMMLLAKMSAEAGKTLNGSAETLISLFDLIYYNLKYRLFTQKTLEMAVSCFLCGCKL